MSQKKRVGVFLPPKHPSGNVIEGNGLMPDDVRQAVAAGLAAQVDIEVVPCDLGSAYIRNGKVYDAHGCLSDLDLVLWYFVTHLPNSWSVTVLRTLAKSTRVVPDPEGLINGLDKFNAHTILRGAGLPTANFWMFPAGNANAIASEVVAAGPALLKPTLGAFGQGIHMVKSPRELIDAVEYGQSFSGEKLQIFCEEFEENDITKWISTTIIDGQLVYGYRKKPEKFVDNWKVYDADRKGGGVDWVDASPVRDVALKAARVLRADVIGFDFIYSTARHQYLIVDENTFPGMYPDCFAESGGSWDSHFLRMALNHLGRGPRQMGVAA
ncbi:MAG: lysX 2 [Alphaproteobacteria bacterium]|jgi:glutathione synthase/RimK-type ligase-like ATP-grasp enzyme|nr:lysX 2 [Alphaproteobacteria bacterium]